MKIAKLMFGGLLIGAAASAAAATDDVGGPNALAIIIFFYIPGTLFFGALPAIYIVFRRGMVWTDKLMWFSELAVIDIGSCGLLYLVFSNGIRINGEESFFSPIPWILVLIPSYVYAYFYKRSVDAEVRGKAAV